MTDRQSMLDRLEARLAICEERIKRLKRMPRRGTKAGRNWYRPYLRELIDRRDAVRIKLEKLKRVSSKRVEKTREEVKTAFRELREAADCAAQRLAWSDPMRKEG